MDFDGSLGVTEEELRILAAAREVGLPLGIPISNFQRIRWVKYVPSDRCAFRSGSLGLSSRLKGKLDPDDWRPLLASQIIYKKTRREGLLPTALVSAAVYLVIFWTGVIVILRTLGLNGGFVAFGYSLASFALWFVNRSTQDTKKRKLRADIQAAKIIGKEKFLEVLHEIDSFRLPDVERTKKSGVISHFSSRPSITARISNLLSVGDLSPPREQVG